MTALERRKNTMNALESKREEILNEMYDYYKNSTSYNDYYIALDTTDYTIISGEMARNNNFIDKSLVIFYRLNLDGFNTDEEEMTEEDFLQDFSYHVFDGLVIPNLQDTLLEIETAEEESDLYY